MKALVFGEILYDLYDNLKVLGGAPLNYSVQLSRLIGENNAVSIISALGNDNMAKDAISFAKKEKIDVSLIELLDNYSTGKATVFLNDDKVPDYIIHEPVAWDNIHYSKNIDLALKKEYDIFYCNILSQRSDESYNTLKKIFERVKAKIKIFDVTVRKNYYNKEKMERTLNFVNILKMNEDELAVIKQLFYPSFGSFNDNFSMTKLLKMIQEDFSIPRIFLTLGKKGACLFKENELIEEIAREVKVVDTVGAGDSFSAALSYAIAGGAEDKKALIFASRVAEEVVQIKGGTAAYDIDNIKNKFLY